MSNGLTDIPGIETGAIIPANAPKIIRIRQVEQKTQNLPEMAKIAMPKHTRRWRKVSADSINIYIPPNVPIVVPSRNIFFGQVEGGDEVVMARNVEERAGNGNGVGNRDKRSGDMDITTSSGSADSKQVKAALLAAGSQYTCYRSRFQGNSSPVSSGPPTSCAECPYGPTRCKCQCRKLKIECLNDMKVSQTRNGEMT